VLFFKKCHCEEQQDRALGQRGNLVAVHKHFASSLCIRRDCHGNDMEISIPVIPAYFNPEYIPDVTKALFKGLCFY